MLLAFNREENSLGVGVLPMPEKWLLMSSEGVCVTEDRVGITDVRRHRFH